MDVGSITATSEPLSPLANVSVDWPGSEQSTVVSEESYKSVTIPRKSNASTFELSDKGSDTSYNLYSRR